MRAPPIVADPWLVGWKSIVEHMEASEKTCRRWAEQAFDPLPVMEDAMGKPIAQASALDAWIGRHVTPWGRKKPEESKTDSRWFPSAETIDGE